MSKRSFKVTAKNPRTGLLTTARGQVQTPCIVPLLKRGTFGMLGSQTLQQAKVQLLAADGLEYSVEPGLKTIQASHGLAGFLNWQGPIMTFSGLFEPADKLKKNASRLGFRYQEPFTKADKRMDAASAATLQKLIAGDLPVAAFQTIDYYAPVDDLLSAVKVNAELATSERALLPGLIPAVLGGGIKKARQLAIGDQSLTAALIAQLPTGDIQEWQRIVSATIDLLPADCLRIVMADSAEQVLAALRLGIDLIVTGLPLVDAVEGEAYGQQIRYRIKESSYQDDTRMLNGHSLAYWHYLHHEKSRAGIQGLSANNLQRLIETVNQDVQEADENYSRTGALLSADKHGNK